MEQHLNMTLQTLPPGIRYVVGGAILRQFPTDTPSHEPELLVIKRAKHETGFPEHWEIPGGSLDPGETARQGLAREIYEETGLVVEEIVRDLGEYLFGIENGTKWVQFRYLVSVKQPTNVRLDPNEHSDWQWTTERGSKSLLRASGQVDVMEQVFRIAKEQQE